MWVIEKIEISGGFLPGLTVDLPQGLTCIIGARGSGKSTLAEAVRFALCGISAAPKHCADLIQANLTGGALVAVTALADGSNRYTIKRGLKQNPLLLASDGRAIDTVDLDRGTFLPLDAYSSLEIEAIADESLGDKRRNLLDELRNEQMRSIHLSLAESARALDTNADRIRSTQRSIADLTEQMEELGDVRGRLSALAPSDRESAEDYVRLSRQQQLDQREVAKLDSADKDLKTLGETLEQLRREAQKIFAARLAEEQSANADTLRHYDSLLAASTAPVEKHLSAIQAKIREAQSTLAQARQGVAEIHTSHAGELAKLTALNQAASEQARARASLEQQVARLEALEHQRVELHAELNTLLECRKSLKTDHILMRDQVSTMRDDVASELQNEAGERVRIRVMRNADHMSYTQTLLDGLKGARVRNQNEILATLMQLRPEQLAQLIQSNDFDSFEELTRFGAERSRKILDAFRETVDPLALEIVAIEDRIAIELNVATSGPPHFKDASDLSRGQKCTALLPILLARRDNPLIIDQPEDNLDNHFIFETVVNAVQRMKKRRQMIFITHNANIPVLAEAELVLVMTSDGRVGAIERRGTVDECREQIIDLLEGGRERSNCALSGMQPVEVIHEKLRRLAVEDPREARKTFLQLFDSGGSALEQFLGQVSSTSDGRLRHLVASALRNNRDKERLAPYLITWHEIETDEFAKRAIASALDGIKTASAAQTALAEEVARLTTAIGRELAQRERLNRELEIAREVQEHLFPQRLPTVPGLDYCGQCWPAREVGGDYYDFLELPDGRLGIAVGDVSGKGVGAALMMASLEASLRALSAVVQDPADLMERVNTLVCQASAANRYASLFYAQYDPATRHLSYVNAGHNPPMVLRNSVGSCQVLRLEVGGSVIGLFPQKYQRGLFSHEPGDLIVLFTDGVSESMNLRDEEWGEERLIELAKMCHGLPTLECMRRILAAAQVFAAGASQHDDMTLVVLRVA